MTKDTIGEAISAFASANDRQAAAFTLRENALRVRTDLRPRGSLAMPAESLVDDQAERVLTDALGDPDELVRTTVAAALGDICGEDCVGGLAGALEDRQLEVALAAAASLGQIGGRAAADALASVATSPHETDLQFAALTALELLTAKPFTSGPDRRPPTGSERESPASMGLSVGETPETSGQASLVAGMQTLERDGGADPFLRQKAGDILSFLVR